MSATEQFARFSPPATPVKPGSSEVELPDSSLAGDESNMKDISDEEQTYTEMAPPKTPANQKAKGSSTQKVNVQAPQPPTSSQRPISLRQGKQTKENESSGDSTEQRGEGEGEGEEQDAPARHELPDFDWTQLETDYHDAMTKANEKEQALLQEFEGLVNYFAAWAQVSQDRDQQRAEKRYKTREAHIRNSELEFAKKKEHYMKVVAAFQQALQLLNLS